jgi:DNA-binding CsgD family transcriptional regulator
LRPEQLAVRFESDVDRHSELFSAGVPVADRLGADLTGTDISVVLGDADVRIVARHTPSERQRHWLDALSLTPGYGWRTATAGTTALGVASTRKCPVMVDGPEHFMNALSAVTTAGAPIFDLRTGRGLGVITLVCPAASTNALLLPVARGAAHEIERRLLDGGSAPARLLARDRPAFGWASLTESERFLAELIADGLTNKQAAARLILSRHTIDAHLRHIFRKLEINSRVELARVVATQTFGERVVA